MGVRWEGGINEFRADLKGLGAEVTRDAILLVTKTAHDAAEEMREKYPVRTGELRAGVTVIEKHDEAAFVANAVVHNVAWYARIFEYGSQTRHTKAGTPNPLPAGKVFIPTAQKYRRQLFGDQLRQALLARGARTVRSNAA